MIGLFRSCNTESSSRLAGFCFETNLVILPLVDESHEEALGQSFNTGEIGPKLRADVGIVPEDNDTSIGYMIF